MIQTNNAKKKENNVKLILICINSVENWTKKKTIN